MPRRNGLGEVYVYTKPSSGWGSVSAPVKLTPPDGKTWDMFGESVAIDGDTVVVGAPGVSYEDIQGATYVFTKPASGWVSTSDAAKLTPETGRSGDLFGSSVAVEGRYDHGRGTALHLRTSIEKCVCLHQAAGRMGLGLRAADPRIRRL